MDHTNAMGQMFYEMISSGQLCPPEERIKFKAPLPKEHFHPFEENGMDFMQAMELTHKALLKWLPIGKETSRFGFEYIKISRMIENAVTTLGRGLMTMRVHGMDLADAPISIGELLKIASFHFQKSYQGAMAAVNSGNQDAFMRLFTNQLRWLNMLQRLERTRDKLNQPFVPAKAEKKTLPQTDASEAALKPLAAPSAIEAPAAIGAAQALRPIISSGLADAQPVKTAKAAKSADSVQKPEYRRGKTEHSSEPDICHEEIQPEKPATAMSDKPPVSATKTEMPADRNDVEVPDTAVPIIENAVPDEPEKRILQQVFLPDWMPDSWEEELSNGRNRASPFPFLFLPEMPPEALREAVPIDSS